MICKKCGATIPNNSTRCSNCGTTISVIPEYNPLEEVLTQAVRSALQNQEPSHSYDVRTDEYRRQLSGSRTNTMYGSEERVERAEREPRGQDTGEIRTPEEAVQARQNARMRKRRQIERRKALIKKRRRVLLTLFLILASVIIGISSFFYTISYSGRLATANRALKEDNYERAVLFFDKAIRKNPSRLDAYEGLVKVHMEQEDMKAAEGVLKTAVKNNESNIELNEYLMEFYISTDQLSKITDFMSNLENPKVKEALDVYESKEPLFSLAEGRYDDVQEVTLTSEEESIYYTLDGTTPTTESLLYVKPIQLGEGITVLKAISVNTKGVASYEQEQRYNIQLPIEMAPVVTPSTGQYQDVMQIVISVPEGYTAYYTMDNTVPYQNGQPTVSAKKYITPIEMPLGTTVFSAVLVNGSGKVSDLTKRNYRRIAIVEPEVEPNITLQPLPNINGGIGGSVTPEIGDVETPGGGSTSTGNGNTTPDQEYESTGGGSSLVPEIQDEVDSE